MPSKNNWPMENRNSWRANTHLAIQEIPRILWDPKCSRYSKTCSYPQSNLSSTCPTLSYFLQIHFNLILHLRLVIPSVVSSHNPVCTSPYPQMRNIPPPITILLTVWPEYLVDTSNEGPRGDAVGWGTVLPAWRSRVPSPMLSWHNPSGLQQNWVTVVSLEW
jgi:hypothetical protein